MPFYNQYLWTWLREEVLFRGKDSQLWDIVKHWHPKKSFWIETEIRDSPARHGLEWSEIFKFELNKSSHKKWVNHDSPIFDFYSIFFLFAGESWFAGKFWFEADQNQTPKWIVNQNESESKIKCFAKKNQKFKKMIHFGESIFENQNESIRSDSLDKKVR